MNENTSIESQEVKTKTAFEYGENTPYVVSKAAEEALYATFESYEKDVGKDIPFHTLLKLSMQFDKEFKKRLNDIELLEDIRSCSECGILMRSGYLIDGGDEYYCSDDCLHAHYTHIEFSALYAGLDHTDKSVLEKVATMTSEELDKLSDDNDSNTYYTDWE